jgi:hypothetical protein
MTTFSRRQSNAPSLPLNPDASNKFYSLPNPYSLPSPPLSGKLQPQPYLYADKSHNADSVRSPHHSSHNGSIDEALKEQDFVMGRRPKARPRGESDLGRPATNGSAPSPTYLSKIMKSNSHSNAHNHSSHHHNHANHSHDDHLHIRHPHSQVTAFFLSFTTPGSIVHSILLEKDSRRIAYFAWYVHDIYRISSD